MPLRTNPRVILLCVAFRAGNQCQSKQHSSQPLLPAGRAAARAAPTGAHWPPRPCSICSTARHFHKATPCRTPTATRPCPLRRKSSISRVRTRFPEVTHRPGPSSRVRGHRHRTGGKKPMTKKQQQEKIQTRVGTARRPLLTLPLAFGIIPDLDHARRHPLPNPAGTHHPARGGETMNAANPPRGARGRVSPG